MSWDALINFDTDKTDTGVVSVAWTDPTYGTFSYTKRVIFTVAERDSFIANAIIERDAWQAQKANEATKKANLLAALSAADPKD
jgi:hypothetical protein